MSLVMERIVAGLGSKQRFTIGHDPREDELTERMNRTLIAMLVKTTLIPMEWDQRIPFVSQLYLLHGYDPYFPIEVTPNERVTPYQVDGSENKLLLLVGVKLARQN
uniref:Uncharacterized protein n=1 Tax=Parascaris equorum TaxID=6256 RepID=A0A914S242_PAREQ